MRYLNARLVDHFVAEDQQVQIERARRARVRALTTALAFDLEQQGQQIAGVERGLSDQHRIQIIRLIRRVWYALRFGLNEIRQRERRDERCEAFGGKEDGRAAIAEVAAQGDGDAAQVQVYPTQRVGNTTPGVPAPSARRPRRSVRPASA